MRSIEPTIEVVVRLVAISAAWYLQQIISAFYSALRGGRMFADGLFGSRIFVPLLSLGLLHELVDLGLLLLHLRDLGRQLPHLLVW